MPRKLYTQDFKRHAVSLLEDSGKSVPKLAKELDIPVNTLYTWHSRYKKKEAFINEPQLDATALELRRLKAENARLKEEREILKKAAAWFAKESEQSTR
ncbi:transposase [Thiotrichales bacterium 19S11-10]|nr:transposase [Thiotrichales bacterium 19S11-10]MCF6808652.1 transposase [Thiotrichales bacterium 19S9-11]MCF6812618.1 transposase [Thiotrichales bacterium 19S9-12]